MSSDEVVVHIEGLSKRYEIYTSPVDRLKQFIYPKFCTAFRIPMRAEYFREFWALKDISFQIKKGETVGIIGRNGSGKSTLLQIICGTLTPTGGFMQTKGRIAALLELGSGFNPEFTGRENVYLNASILGLSRREIDEKFHQIEQFAGIGDFIDQPVKTYSSGMYVRLAFAVSVNVQPDILIIDEALAVGDLAFQAKCMNHLKKLMDEGVTIVFVSHDVASVRNLCGKILWLDHGIQMEYGYPESIIGKYIEKVHLSINDEISGGLDRHNQKLMSNGSDFDLAEGYRRYGTGKAVIVEAKLLDVNRVQVNSLRFREDYVLQFLVEAKGNVTSPAFGFSFRDLKGNPIVGSLTSNYKNLKTANLISGEKYRIEIHGTNNLVQGNYSIMLAVESVKDLNRTHEFVDIIENAIVFKSIFSVDNHDIFYNMVWQDVEFNIEKVIS